MLIPRDIIEGFRRNVEHHHSITLLPDFEIYHDMEVFDGWVYPSRNGLSPVDHRPGFGWSDLHVFQVRSKMENQDYKNIVPRQITKKYAAVISFPGGYTYGHWVIDISTRLYQCLKYFDRNDICFLLPKPLPQWAAPFLAAFSIRPEDFIEISDKDLYQTSTLLLPSLYRVTDFLPLEPYRSVFHYLRNNLGNSQNCHSGRNLRLLLEHTPISSAGQRPTLENFSEVREALSSLGFFTLRSAELSHDSQAELFRHASIIVGEDSSGLHNIFHCINNNAHLIVLSGDRINLLHISLSRIMNIQCDYIQCYDESTGSFQCDTKELVSFISHID